MDTNTKITCGTVRKKVSVATQRRALRHAEGIGDFGVYGQMQVHGAQRCRLAYLVVKTIFHGATRRVCLRPCL